MDIFLSPKLYVEQEPSCPACGAKLSGVTPVATTPEDSALPDPGDLTVCIYCATLLQFGEGLKLRVLTEEDWDEIKRTQPDVRRLLDAMVTAVQIRVRKERETKKRWH